MKHFCFYLLDQNLVTANQLETCFETRLNERHNFGHYAVTKGIITEFVRKQIQHKKRLPESNNIYHPSGVDGFVSENQLFELLKYQAFNHNYLGLSLVKLGYMTVNNLTRHLTRFKNMMIESNDVHGIDYHGQHGAELIQKEAIIHHRSFLFNTGYATQLESVTPGFEEDDSKLRFATSLKLNRRLTYFVGVSIEKDTLFDITQPKSEEFGISADADELCEIFGQILFNLNYSVSRKLRNKGLKLKHGPVQYYFPAWQDRITTRCRLLNGFIDISIMH